MQANFKDMPFDQYTVTDSEIEQFMQAQNSELVMLTQCSMKDGLGMDAIATFFSIPYLRLKVNTSLPNNNISSNNLLNELWHLQLRSENR